MGSAVIHRVLGDAHPGHRERQRTGMRITAQPIEVAVVAQQATWAGIAEELVIAETTPLGHEHVFAAQRFAAAAGKAENPPIVDNFERGDRQQKAAARAATGFVGLLGVRSGNEVGAVITAGSSSAKSR
jgi:hypothetical protein